MQRGEVYFVELVPSSDREPGGTRPVIVLANDPSPYVVPVLFAEVAPATPFATSITIPASESGAADDLSVDIPFLRTLDPARFPAKPAGQAPTALLDRIDSRSRSFLRLPEKSSSA